MHILIPLSKSGVILRTSGGPVVAVHRVIRAHP
jgi:hypothetical protein